jgi:arylsulfatase A-like enzyme
MAQSCDVNILVITTDQQRWDTLGRSNPAIRTPHLDALADDGILFERAYTVNPVCTPARISMLTGQYPSRHGCWHCGTSLPEDYAPAVSRTLGEAGYFTGLLGKAHFRPCLDAESFEAAPHIHDAGFFRGWSGPYHGFEHAKLVIGHTSESHASGMHYGVWLREQGVRLEDYFGMHDYMHVGAWELPEEYHGSRWVADETIAAIDMAHAAGRPFFLWASFQDPHNPLMAPEPWASMYAPDSIPPPLPPDVDESGKPPFYASLQRGEYYGNDPELQESAWGDCRIRPGLSGQEVQAARAMYYGMVSLMDKHLGRILEALRRRGIYDETLIIFTTDHGDYLGDYGLWGKGLPCYDAMQRLPFIVRHPDCGTRGERSAALQSLVDIPLTLLAASGCELPAGMQGVNQGAAWKSAHECARQWALVEARPAATAYQQLTLVTDRHKLAVYHGREYGELYDVTEDPEQRVNLFDSASHRRRRDELLKQLIDARMECDGVLRPRTAPA